MAQLNTLTFSSSPTSTTLIPPNFTSTSSILYPTIISPYPSSKKPTSLYRNHSIQPIYHILRCTSSGSILTVETPSLETQQKDDVVVVNEVSTTRLLAQNVPWSSTVGDIRALFQQYGTVVDVELSMHSKTRNRGLAFVEMGSPEEAAEALAKLEAFEYEGRTLKLNYATLKKKKTPPVQPKPPVVYNLFVANLSFEARAKDLKEFFGSSGGEVVSAEVIFHENPRKSAGYGFVSFKTKKEADDALVGFEGKELFGRPIRVARSNRFVKLETEIKPKTEEAQDMSTDSSEGSDQPEA